MESAVCDGEKFQCRKCRFILFDWSDLSEHHDVTSTCSLWFLRDDDMLPWIQELVNESGWTKGKLFCPHCSARVGAFDFLHVITCECSKDTIPSIYCVKSKVDHTKNLITRNIVTNDNITNESHDNDTIMHEQTTSYERIELTEFHANTRERNVNTHNNNAFENHDFIESIDNYEILDSCIVSSENSERQLVDEEEPRVITLQQPNMQEFFQKMDHGMLTTPCNTRKIDIQSLFQSTEIPFLTSQEITTRSTAQILTEEESCHSHVTDHQTSKYSGSISTFQNPCFDPSESDNEDILVNAKTLTEFKRSVRNKPRDYRSSPRVLTCLRCRDTYESFLRRSEQRRNDRSCICDQNCGDSQSDSLDDPKDDSRNCTCSNNRQFEIYNDLISVREDMANLQDLIQTTATVWPSERRHRHRNRRHRHKSNRRFGEHKRESNDDDGDERNSESDHLNNQDSDFEIPDHFQCPVCLDIYYEPYVTECSHTFCAPCLRQLNKSSNRRPLCPLCRRQVWDVENCQELHDDVKRLYPKQYRQRHSIERRRAVNRFPLPSRTSVRFHRERSNFSNHIVHMMNVASTFLIILFMFITFAVNREGRNNRQQSLFARVFYVLLIILIVTFVSAVILLLFTFYAYDLFKYLIGFVLFYVIIVKYAMAVVSE